MGKIYLCAGILNSSAAAGWLTPDSSHAQFLIDRWDPMNRFIAFPLCTAMALCCVYPLENYFQVWEFLVYSSIISRAF